MEFCEMKREIDRKCLNHARIHANAQSFDRCEYGDTLRPPHTSRFFCRRAADFLSSSNLSGHQLAAH